MHRLTVASQLYTGLIAALTVFSELAILRAAEGAAGDQDRAVMPIADSARKRANSGVCRYLRGARVRVRPSRVFGTLH